MDGQTLQHFCLSHQSTIPHRDNCNRGVGPASAVHCLECALPNDLIGNEDASQGVRCLLYVARQQQHSNCWTRTIHKQVIGITEGLICNKQEMILSKG